MSVVPCPFEPQVAEATANGRWTPHLTNHLAECGDCADLALVSGLLQATEEPRELAVDVAEAGRIWKRAEEERRLAQGKKALLPLKIGELSACLLGGIALVGFSARHAVTLAQGIDIWSGSLVANPVVIVLGIVTAGIAVGIAFVSLVMALGFGFSRS